MKGELSYETLQNRTVCITGLFLAGAAMAVESETWESSNKGLMEQAQENTDVQDQSSESGEYSQPIGATGEQRGSALERQSDSQQEMAGQQRMDQQNQQQVAAGGLDSDQIREIQKNLQEEGIEAGPVDGIMGPKTREGLRNFQQEEGLAATGEPNQETLEALGVQEFTGVSPRFEEQDVQQQKQDQNKMEQPDRMQQEQDSGRLDHLQPEGAREIDR